MDAEDHVDPKDVISYYAQAGAYDQLAELAKHRNPEVQKAALLALAEKEPELARQCAKELLEAGDLESEVSELAREITGEGGKQDVKTRCPSWSSETVSRWEHVERGLKELKINTLIMLRWKERKKAERKELEKAKRTVAVLLACLRAGKPLQDDDCEKICYVVTHKDVEEKFKLEILSHFPKIVMFSKREEKDMLFSAAYFLVEKGDKVCASNKLMVSCIHVLGKMLDALRKVQEEMGGIPDKDKIFHAPKSKNPFLAQELAKAKVKVQ